MANHLPVDDYDLIVMGGVGDNNPSKPVIGANTAKVLRTSKTPVLVVKKDVSLPVAFDTIVFASGLEPDTHKAFAQLLSFAETMGASNLHLVEVTTPNNFKPTFFVREKMEAFISKHRVKNIQIHNYNHYTIEAGVFEFAKRVNASLLAIANHGRNDITSLFIESVPENLVKFSDVPVLSIMV
ncbi:MAG: universal stress protein [Saprospiraceae bacterium]